MLKYNIKLVVRNLSRNKLYSFLSISGFAIGFAVCLYIGLYLYGEAQMDSWVPNNNRIVRLIDPKGNTCGLDIRLNEILKSSVPEVEQACSMELSNGFDIPVKSGKNLKYSKGIINTQDDFFKIFPLKVIESNGKTLFEGKQSVVITESMALSLFHDNEAVGRTITIFNSMEARVTAVVADFPKNSSIQADIFTSSENVDFRFNKICDDGKCWNPANHFVLLKKSANLASFQNNLNRNVAGKEFKINSLAVQKLLDIFLATPLPDSSLQSGNVKLLWILASFGMLILLLSTFNFLNFYISMQYLKIKEVAIKKINGAQFNELLKYSLTEVSISIFLSLLAAFAIFLILFPTADILFDHRLDLKVLTQKGMLLIITTVVLVLIMINSVIPIYILTKFSFQNILVGTKSLTLKQWNRKFLTSIQFTFSIALIILTLSMFRQIDYVKHANLGFGKENLIRLNFPNQFKKQKVMRDKLNEMKGIVDFTFSNGVPGRIHLGISDFVNNKSISLQCLYADQNFLKTLGIKLKQGHDFREAEIGEACIMNEEAYKQFGWKNLEGKRFNQAKEGGYEVIGIVDNFFTASMYKKIDPVCILSSKQNDEKSSYVSIRLAKGDLNNQMRDLRKIWSSLIPDEPISFTFYDEFFGKMYEKEERLGKSIAVAAIVALILTFFGVLGQALQMTLNRTKEIGIRKVNGANLFKILLRLNIDFIPLLVAAYLVALPTALYLLNKWLGAFAYKASISWFVFLFAGVIVFLTVGLTVTLISWNTATRNPVEALKHE